MRTLVGILVVGFLVGGMSFADDKKETPKGRGALPTYFKKLGLNESQEAKCKEIHTEFRGKITDLEEQIKKLRRDEIAAYSKVLTDDQKKRLRDMIEKRVIGDYPVDKPSDKQSMETNK
jgi:hypothetical protein